MFADLNKAQLVHGKYGLGKSVSILWHQIESIAQDSTDDKVFHITTKTGNTVSVWYPPGHTSLRTCWYEGLKYTPQ